MCDYSMKYQVSNAPCKRTEVKEGQKKDMWSSNGRYHAFKAQYNIL